MNEREVKLVIGCLLHDVGKILYRHDDKRNHSLSGVEFLSSKVGIDDKDILECVKYHHAKNLSSANVAKDSLAYIACIADNIASAADRREEEEGYKGFDITTPLSSVFNLLNGNNAKMFYSPYTWNEEIGINYPSNDKVEFVAEAYSRIIQNVLDNLKRTNFNENSINSILGILEGNLSYVPSSTYLMEVPDISLYDHMKLTAAIASCIIQYASTNNIIDYKNEFLTNSKQFYDKDVFLMASMDISGIQKFIYTITSKSALKMLRARSFYLEILMEHIVDELLMRLNLSRANLIYSGGGHCYLLLPNIEECREKFDVFMQEVNSWFLEKFNIALYIAGAYTPCSSNALNNTPIEDSPYSAIYKELSEKISAQKNSRYSYMQLIELNQRKFTDYTRECKVCKSIGKVNEEGRCSICESLVLISKDIFEKDFFSIVVDKGQDGLELPLGYKLIAETEDSLRKRIKENTELRRAYSKNRRHAGEFIATNLWIADYSSKYTLEEFANDSEGINRIGVLRADVDNLGNAFVNGFRNHENNDRYVTLSRTVALSRQLSLFFKYHIKEILENPKFKMRIDARNKRNATIIYSGGDDIFMVGSWNDIIELSVDIRRAFERYTQGTLSLSAGIGIYNASYPISVIADEVGSMESESKKYPNKNAVTLFEDGQRHRIGANINDTISDGTYSWQDFEEKVIFEKFELIQRFFNYFNDSDNYGKAFIYKLLDLIRNQNDAINFARYVYLLARMEPKDTQSDEIKAVYSEFRDKMFRWMDNYRKQLLSKDDKLGEDIRHLKTAINMYVYLIREREV